MIRLGRLSTWTAGALAALVLSAKPATAANNLSLIQDAGAWAQVVAEGSLGFIDPNLKPFRFWLEGQSRWDGNFAHWYQGMARSAVGYSLTDRATVWFGYTFLPTQQIGKPYVGQQDIWPAFRYVLPTKYGTFMSRTMWETNFIASGSVRQRPRQMFRFLHPLSFEPRLSAIGWDEVFVRVNNTEAGGNAGFDQNRAFAGLGWTFDKHLRAEFGYLNQYLQNTDHTQGTMHHLMMGSLFITF